MNKSGLISVIIPVYNSEKYLRECLDSVINQSYKNLEIIIVNDGSTDNSLNIINEFAKKDKRIKVFNQPNSGGSVALNSGVKYSTGEYIHFLDSDDYLENGAYDLLIKSIKQDDSIDACFCSYYLLDETNKTKNKRTIVENNLMTDLESNPEVLIYYDSAQWMIFAKSSLIKKNNIKFDNTYFGYDMLFHLNIIKHAKKIFILNDRLINYRINNPNSSSGSLTRSKQYSIHFDCFYHCIGAYNNEKKEIYDVNVCRQYDVCFDYWNGSLEEYKINNFFNLYKFSISLSPKLTEALKIKNDTFKRYKSILNYEHISNLLNNLMKEKDVLMKEKDVLMKEKDVLMKEKDVLMKEKECLEKSKTFKLGKIIVWPYRFVKKTFKRLVNR